MGQGPRQLWSEIGSFLSLERNVLVMSITGLLINFGYLTFQPFIPLYLRTLEADITEIGIVFVAIQLAATLVSIPGGILADRLGRKTIIVVGNAVGYALFFILLGAKTWTIALLTLFAATLFATLVQPAYSSTVAESVNKEERGRAFGTFLFMVYLGLAFGAAVGGYFSYRVDIFIVAGAGVIAAVIRLFFLRETLPPSARANRQTGHRSFFTGNLTRNVWLLLFALLVFNFSSGLGQPLYAIFSTDILQLSKSELGIMVGVGYLASMLGAFFAGRVSERLGIANTMSIAVILASLFLVPWLYAPSALLAIGIFSMSGFFAQFFFVGNQALMANITRPEERGSIIGFITTVAGFGSIAAPYVGSQIWIAMDPRTPFLLSALLAVGVVAPLALIHEPTAETSCPHCGRGLPVEARFCDMCGRPIHFKNCWGCGRELEESARFCDECGRDQPVLAVPAK